MKMTARPSPRMALPLALALAVSACTSAGVPGQSAAPATSPAPGITSVATGPSQGFYLRLWQTQALAPQYTLGRLPPVTIADGWFYDGMIAIPAIYPGPIYSSVSRRHITGAGIQEIVGAAGDAGLLGDTKSFGQVPPGGITCHVTLVIAGVTNDLSGPCAAADPAASASPGTAAAFVDFVVKLQTINMWLAADLDSSQPWTPDSIAVLASPPAPAEGAITPGQVEWPLAVPFSRFGNATGSANVRCAVVSGGDLAVLLPAIESANVLTRFTDSEGVARTLAARPLLPGEPSPC